MASISFLSKNKIKTIKLVIFLSAFLVIFLGGMGKSWAANYPLEIINIDEVGANNRIKWAYPNLEYKVRIFAHGGTYPFSWSLTENTTCDATINQSTGVVSWISPQIVDSGCMMEVSVTDAEAITDTENYTVTVTDSTSRFIFMDANNSASGRDGSFSSPFQNFSDFWATGGQANKILYMRDGTYSFAGVDGNNSRGVGAYRITYSPATSHPIAMLSFPGELPIWSGTRGWDGANTGKHFYGGGVDMYFQGIEFTNQYAYAFELANNSFSVWHDCIFSDQASHPSVYINDASLSWQTSAVSSKIGIGGCSFEGGMTGNFITGVKNYDVRYQVLEGNTFSGHSAEGISWKDNTDYSVSRNNIFDGNFRGIGIAGYGEEGTGGCEENEIAFNYFTNSTEPALRLNSSGTIANVYIYRNTFNNDHIEFRSLNSSDQEFYIRNNVIVNNLSMFSGAEIDDEYQRNRSWFYYNEVPNVFTNNTTWSGNLFGTLGDNIIDSSGLLQSSYRDTYLGTAGWETLSGGFIDAISPNAPTSLEVL